MRANQIILVASLLIFSFALWARITRFDGLSAHGRYYLTAILVIAGVLALITALRRIRLPLRDETGKPEADVKPTQPKRLSYRIRFEDDNRRPIFLQNSDIPGFSPDFTCPVSDISETGIGLVCAGAFDPGETVLGSVIFADGRTVMINGVVVRQTADQTFLRLHCTIDPPLLMAVQRRQIESEKAMGPLPSVSRDLLDREGRSLPSHAPKGICQRKRS